MKRPHREPVELPLPPRTRRRNGVLAAEHADQLEFLERCTRCRNLLRGGASPSLVLETLRTEFVLTEVQANHVYGVVLKEMQALYEAGLPQAKAAQLERIGVLLTQLYAETRDPKKRLNVSGIAQLENLYAKIAGTYAPLRVKVDTETAMTDGLMALVVGLTQEDRQRLFDEQRDLEQRAADAAATRH